MHSRASPLWPVLGSPVGGVGTGAGLCDFYRAGEDCGAVAAVAIRSPVGGRGAGR